MLEKENITFWSTLNIKETIICLCDLIEFFVREDVDKFIFCN